jgi:hypothetical protein
METFLGGLAFAVFILAQFAAVVAVQMEGKIRLAARRPSRVDTLRPSHKGDPELRGLREAQMGVVTMFKHMGRAAFCLGLLISAPLAMAQDGRIAAECVDAARPQDRVSFVLDFDRQAVAGAFPVNWAWFTRTYVLFQYSALINGDQHTMQTYILDRTTRVLEICDFAAGQEQACGQRSCALSAWNGEPAPPPVVRASHGAEPAAPPVARARHADQLTCISGLVGDHPCVLP